MFFRQLPLCAPLGCCRYKASWFKARCSGSSSLRCKSQKLGCQLWGSVPSILQQKLRAVNSLPTTDLLCQGWGLWQECASASPTYFNVGFFLICSMCRSCSSSFWVSFRGSCFVSSYRFAVSVGGGSKSSYVTILNQSPLYRTKYKIMRSQSKCKIMKSMKGHPRGNMRSRTSKSQYDLCLPLYTLFTFQRQNQVNTNTVSQWDMVERNEGSSLL